MSILAKSFLVVLAGMVAASMTGTSPVEAEITNAEIRLLSVKGAHLVYEVAGSGPAIVLLHAGVADMRMWDEPFKALSKHFRVVRYDERGFGRSVTEAVEFSNRQDLLDLLNHLKIERAWIVGNSRGGQIAIDFALEHPTRVEGVVAVAAGVSGYDSKPTKTEQDLFDRVDALSDKKEFEKLAELESAIWADGPGQKAGRAPKKVREMLKRMILNNYRTHTSEPKAIPLKPPAAQRLAELQLPLLVMIGDLDESGTRSAADVLAEKVKGARKIVYPGVAHMISLERPKEFIREVSSFVNAKPKR